MPSVIDYPIVRDRLLSLGLVCNYYNGGAFGFPKGTTPAISGWIGPDDPTIRPEMKPVTKHVPPPHELNLASALSSAWDHADLGEVAWVMPAAHWAFELDFGSTAWMSGLLTSAGIDPQALRGRTDASAIAFPRSERRWLTPFVQGLLTGLKTSDFVLIFPDTLALCMLHHHRQIWWQVKAKPLLDRINASFPA